MGDSGGIAAVGGLIIVGVFLATPILIILFIFSRKAPLGRARPFISSIIGVALLPFIVAAFAFAYALGKSSLESYLNSKKGPNDWKHKFDMNGIHYEVAQQRSWGTQKLPDGTHVFGGDPLKFTEKDGLITINGKITIHANQGDTVEVYSDGTAKIK